MKRTRPVTRWTIRIAVVATAFAAGVLVSAPIAHSLAGHPAPASISIAATAPPTTSAPAPVAPAAPPVSKRPLRVLLIGDSIMWQSAPTVEKALQPQVAGRRVTLVKLGLPGTGLVSTGDYDWKSRAQRLIDQVNPDLVVALFIGNCPQPLNLDANGHPLVCDTPAFYDAWAHAADELTGIMTSRGAQAVWVLPPPEMTVFRPGMTQALRAGYLKLAQTHPGLRYIDAQAVLGGPHGEWLRSAPGPTGATVPLRAPDSVHLATEGSRRMGAAILFAVQPDIDRGNIRT